MKTCIFIVGKGKTGKSSIIRGLTGCWIDSFWKINDLSGNRIWAMVLLSAIGERPPVSVENFLEELEAQIRKKKRNKGFSEKYRLIICPIRITPAKKYIESAITKGLNVKVAGIETDWKGTSINLKGIGAWCDQKNVPYLSLNANNDDNVESGKIRQKFYPK